MIKSTLLASVVALLTGGFLSNPALAGHCPRDVRVIDQALKTTKLSGDNMSMVKSLRDKGKEQHESGDHGASLDSLHAAMKILGIPH